MLPGLAGIAGFTGGDPFWASVVFYATLEGAEGGTNWADLSRAGTTINSSGNVQTDTGVAGPVGGDGSSTLFDGTRDHLELDNAADLTFGSGEWTIEMFIYFRVFPGSGAVQMYDGRNEGTGGSGANISFYLDSADSKLKFYSDNAVRITSTNTAAIGKWYHMALCKSDSTTRMFIDGIQEGSSYTDSTTYIGHANRPYLGEDGNAPTYAELDGNMAHVRITKGVGRYSTNFSVPSIPFLTA